VNGNVLVTGDVRLAGGDCAEAFDVIEGEELDPGTVMVIGDEDTLFVCTEPYDSRVAGVLSLETLKSRASTSDRSMAHRRRCRF
jgi:hypothetical protein